MESAAKVDELYEQYIRRLTPQQKRQLMEKLAHDLALQGEPAGETGCSLLHLVGLGAEIWQAMDAQQYVNALRDEWDHPQ
ncbi:MAG: hypothetical protein N2045_01790 [Fimbriimonadales bacterium]|jgi:hypothetical protein|nr:hypothetical protein [Fimbriimonadales bacterium]GBC90091.1 hypothetical protein HRbin14_00823 [bacterium HR14]GIV13393.1 MAG: hypothetical protein KatS3mg021_1675 [Fimbriimonadales bacterium]CUU10707.1 hypothetical protein GBSOP10_107613 [Armatimonadetes bacterium GBS]CUU35984.1 hypothetical protein GXSOP10_12279 [Armatimonadetes bacterium GXS]